MAEQMQPRILPNRIREFRVARGYTLEGLASKIGTSNQYLSFIETGRRRLSQPWMEKIAAELNCWPSDLLPDTLSLNTVSPSPTKDTGSIPDFPINSGDEISIPVYASMFNDRTGMSISLEIVELIPRPKPLYRVKGGFGVYVVGDTMAPAYCHGDLLLVRSGKIANPGDDVLIIMKDSKEHGVWIHAYIKKFVAMEKDRLRLRQWSPEGDVELSPSQFSFMHPVVGVYRK